MNVDNRSMQAGDSLPVVKGGLPAVVRVLWDAAAYRLRMREGANLATSMALAVAVALPAPDIAWRFAFGLLLNVFIYLMNDCFDVRLDLRAPGRRGGRTEFLSGHLGAGWTAVGLLGVALAGLGALHGLQLFVAFAAGGALTAAYSARLKGIPGLDVVTVSGICLALTLLGFRWDSAAGWYLAGLAAVLCAVTQTIQELRDYDGDRGAGVRTTAVALGPSVTAGLTRLLVLAASTYACLLLHRWVGLVFLPALFIPLGIGPAARSWNLFRVVFGLGWLALLAAFRLGGGLHGWIGVS